MRVRKPVPTVPTVPTVPRRHAAPGSSSVWPVAPAAPEGGRRDGEPHVTHRHQRRKIGNRGRNGRHAACERSRHHRHRHRRRGHRRGPVDRRGAGPCGRRGAGSLRWHARRPRALGGPRPDRQATREHCRRQLLRCGGDARWSARRAAARCRACGRRRLLGVVGPGDVGSESDRARARGGR